MEKYHKWIFGLVGVIVGLILGIVVVHCSMYMGKHKGMQGIRWESRDGKMQFNSEMGMDMKGMAGMSCAEGGMCEHKMGMEKMMSGMTSAMQGKSGVELDKIFLSEMIMHHQGAVDMANLVLASSQNAELKTFAKNIITAQSQEIEQMKTWQAKWK